MRFRTIILIIAIALVAGFAALNIDEFSRTSTLSLGVTTVQVPLGLVMLFLLVVAVLIFLGTTIYVQSVHMLETRKYARDLTAQRELADRAEASRFTELRTYLESQTTATIHREAANASVIAERMAQAQTTLLHRLEQSDNATAAYVGQLEDRLERGSASLDNRSVRNSPLV